MEDRVSELLAGILIGGSYALGIAAAVSAALYAANFVVARYQSVEIAIWRPRHAQA
jgi:hypothetical protein